MQNTEKHQSSEKPKTSENQFFGLWKIAQDGDEIEELWDHL